MINVVIIMSIGITIGVILNKKIHFIATVEKLATYSTWLLLFLLGISIGSNQVIIRNIGTLGIEAFILSFGAISGSVLLSFILYRFFKDE